MGSAIKYAMVGGGPGAFIGEVHRKAARLDGEFELVAGAFSQTADKSAAMGQELGLNPHRVYSSWREMLAREAALPEQERIELVAIVTPNDTHVPVSIAALEAGFHVMCDKPAARTLDEALELDTAIKAGDKLYGLTHTYLGYPMVRDARDLVASGQLGNIRKVMVTYPQGWLSEPLEQSGQKQASWRTNPALSGPAGGLGDIGTHASTLAEFIVGSRISSVCADVSKMVDGRVLDDDTSALFRMHNGTKGVLTCSQIMAGEVNGLRIAVYGDKAGLTWSQETANDLTLKPLSGPAETRVAGANHDYLTGVAQSMCRTPAGHPEGYLEAFANLYGAMASEIRRGKDPAHDARLGWYLPGIEDGLAGLAFIKAALESEPEWTSVEHVEVGA